MRVGSLRSATSTARPVILNVIRHVSFGDWPMSHPTSPDYQRLETVTQLNLTPEFKAQHSRLAGRNFSVAELVIELTYQDGNITDDYIERFLTVDEIQAQWQHVSYLSDFVQHFALGQDFVEPGHLIPFADTAAGCIYVAVGGAHSGSVYHSDNGDFGICRVADKLDVFIEYLAIPDL